MEASEHWRGRRNRVLYFFPFQLAALHVQRNHFLLILWIILFGFTTRAFANKFGIPYLFLAPEYRGEVGLWSYAILGFSLGGFIMAFNIYSYILHAKRFPFLGTLNRPFLKYCINNCVLPLAFTFTYISCSSAFLSTTELKSTSQIVSYMLAFLLGNGVFIALSFLYFFPTNKNIYKITGRTEVQMEAVARRRKLRSINKRSANGGEKPKKWHVETYLQNPLKISLARDITHYDAGMLDRVFLQNHVNASLFEILVIASFLIIGSFQFNSYFVIPAAASACLVFTVLLMVLSILMSWLKGWTLSVLLALILVIDFASGEVDLLNMTNPAYGLDYVGEPVPYTNRVLDSLSGSEAGVSEDLENHKRTLRGWLAAEQRAAGDSAFKPKLIIINTSGGGLRSSLWTMRTLQYCDSILGGDLMRRSRLISGSSGGMIGAAYYRELYLRRDTLEPRLQSPVYLDNISKDILNRVLFTFATNDIFVRFRRAAVHDTSYVLDRGMTFEDQLNRNTAGVLDQRLSRYAKPVADGEIPLMVLAPSIVNDGRRLLIASQPIGFLTYESPGQRDRLNLTVENVEFRKLFAAHDADSLLLTSALRMNSTFPYILPYPSLPTKPRMEVMDAGLRDNFGMKVTLEYIFALRDWIEQHTSGVVIIQIRDTEERSAPKGRNPTILNKLTNPIGTFYGNYFNDQDFNMDQMLKITEASLDVPLDQVVFEIRVSSNEHIALSWHLTELEKVRIRNAIYLPWNQASVNRLQRLIED